MVQIGISCYLTSMRREDYIPLIERALEEDLGSLGDVTSQAIFSDEIAELGLYSKDTGVLAGAEVFRAVYERVDESVDVRFEVEDGTRLVPDQLVAVVRGGVLPILAAERTSINFLSFMSGIATAARKYVDAARRRGDPEVLDTRKTLPGYRILSKYAASVGGILNHRMGLHDMVLIKDNHIDSCGSISKTVDAVRERWNHRFRIEVECRTLDEVREAVGCNVDVVMLDNMDNDTMKRAVELTGGKTKLEASGGVTLGTIEEIGSTGVDYISVGAVTHSVAAFDFSLRKRM